MDSQALTRKNYKVRSFTIKRKISMLRPWNLRAINLRKLLQNVALEIVSSKRYSHLRYQQSTERFNNLNFMKNQSFSSDEVKVSNILSASHCTGAPLVWASSTTRTKSYITRSPPALFVSTVIVPLQLIAPAIISSWVKNMQNNHFFESKFNLI